MPTNNTLIVFQITMLIDGVPFALSNPIPAQFTGNPDKVGALTSYEVKAGFASGTVLHGQNGAPDFYCSALNVSLSNRGANQAQAGQAFIDRFAAEISQANKDRADRPAYEAKQKVTFTLPTSAPPPAPVKANGNGSGAPVASLPALAMKIAKEQGLGDIALALYREEALKLGPGAKRSDYQRLALTVKNASA